MITKLKLEIYKKYNGESDGIDRGANELERNLFENNDWSTIQSLIQDIRLIENKSTSTEYEKRVLNDIKSKVKNDCIKFLYEIANQTNINRTE